MTTIHQAISAVMGDVHVVRKSDRNAVQGFNFRGIDAVMNAVGPALREHGVIVVPTLESSEYTTVVIGKNRTEMSHAQLVVSFTWYGPDGDSIVCKVAAEAMDSGDKAISKAHSVAMRTAMIQTLALPTDEADADESTFQRAARKPAAAPAAPVKVARPQPEPPREPELQPANRKPITSDQTKAFHTLFGKLGYGEGDRDAKLQFVAGLLGLPELKSSKDLTLDQTRVVLDELSKRVEALNEA